MAELLEYERNRRLRILVRKGLPPVLTLDDFEDAWAECWALMKTERAWPHLTSERRGWRAAQMATKAAVGEWFIGDQKPTFAVAFDGLRDQVLPPSAGLAGAVVG